MLISVILAKSVYTLEEFKEDSSDLYGTTQRLSSHTREFENGDQSSKMVSNLMIV